MGTGSSVQPKVGVHSNPLIVYADQRSKKSKSKKDLKIDTPVLVDLSHGTVRYRYEQEGKKNKNNSNERPFEGDEKVKKGHYFYHPRLTDFSEKAAVDREDPYKFMYVVKGPANAKQKKIFYVYGKGWNALKAKDGDRVKPTKNIAMAADPTWPQRQNPNDVYYNITPMEYAPAENPMFGTLNKYILEFIIADEETVNNLRKKIALTIIKSPINVHVCYEYNALGNDVVLSTLGGEDSPTQGVRATLMER